jgi:RHS repeat-associated protein
MPRDLARRAARLASLLLAGCDLGSASDPTLLAASPGLPRYQEAGAIAVPGGTLNAAGGNLMIRRVDLSIDTKLGTQELAAVYNSKTRSWRWSFEMRWADDRLVDAQGAEHADLLRWGVGNGTVIPGSVWIKVDAWRIQSVGGLLHEFASDGRLAALRWQSGPHPRLEYLAQPIAGAPRTTEIRQCSAPGACSTVASLAYDAAGRVVAITDRAGRVALLGYDANGWLAIARDALDVELGLPGTRYEYREGQRLFAQTSSEGERIEYAWHWNQGRITEARALGAGDAVHRFEYARDANPWAPHTTTHVDPAGQRTVYRYDSERRLHRVTLPTGESIGREWSGLQVTRLVEPGGVVTRFVYVDDDEVTRTDPSGNALRFDFRLGSGENRADPYRRPIEAIDDSLGSVERRGYDGLGRLAWVENGAGERTSFAWSAANLLASETRPDGIAALHSAYGEHGHAQAIATAGEVATRVFDAVGNPVSTSGLERLDTRPGGELWRRYDADRNLVELRLADLPESGAPIESSIRIAWRSDRRVLRIDRPGGGDHEFDYDAQGRLVARRERSGGAWAATLYELDALGRTVAETLPNGMRREVDFDAAGRQTALRALRHGALEGELLLAWTDGRPASADDSLAGGVESYEWDAAGELAAIAYPGGERLEIERDPRGRPVRETYRLADGSLLREIGFAWDGAGRSTRLEEDGALLVAQAWAAGRLASTSYGNGLVRGYAYDPATGLLVAATSVGPGGAVVEASGLAILEAPASGELRLVAETASAGPAAAATREEFALGPLAGEGKRLLAWSDGAVERLHAADALSNESLRGGDAFVYDAEGSRLLARVDAASGTLLTGYAWDAAGYCVSRGGVALEWTALGRIAAIGPAASFEWDLLGRPLRRVVAGEERRFRFGGRVETDAAGLPRRLELGAVSLRLDTGERRYRHLDFRGNVKLESDDAGGVALHLRYGPTGIDASFGAGDGAATFAGGRDLGGLLLVGTRVLDPDAGRFLSPDPLLQLVNQYSYTLANPVTFWDPDGLQWSPIGFAYGTAGAVGAGIVGAGVTAAAGGSTAAAILGATVGGPIGFVLGIAFAQMIHQQLTGERGPFGAADALKMATPLYVDPPGRDPGGDQSGRPSSGSPRRLAPPPPAAPDIGTPPGFSSSSFRFGAWGVGGVSGAIGGGFGGF